MWADNEDLDVDKLNAMTNNDQWLFENMPRARYAGNVSKDSGVKILGTRAVIGPNTSSSGGARIYFGNTFSTGCTPIVVASVIPTNWQRRFHCVVNGLGKNIFPDHNGCLITVSSAEVNPKNMKMASNVYVQVVAIGW
jgi:hypothetical protein